MGSLQLLLLAKMSFGLRVVSSNSVCNLVSNAVCNAGKNSAGLRAPLTTAVAHRAKHGSEGSNGSGGQGSVHALALTAGLALAAAAKAYSERERLSLKAETAEVKVHENRVHHEHE